MNGNKHILLKAEKFQALLSKNEGTPLELRIFNPDRSLKIPRAAWRMDVDGASLRPEGCGDVSVESRETSAVSTWTFDGHAVRVEHSVFGWGLRQRLSVERRDGRPFTVREVRLLDLHIDGIADDAFDYMCSENRRLAILHRFGDFGLLVGNEYPFTQHDWTDSGAALSYRPSFKVEAGERFYCEPTFLSVYPLTGYATGLCLTGEKPGRLGDPAARPNPLDRILDLGEADALSAIVRGALPRRQRRLLACAESWWIAFLHPEKMTPFISWCRNREDESAITEKILRMAREMKSLGVDLFSMDRVFENFPDWPPKEWMHLDLLPNEERPWWRITKLGEKIARRLREMNVDLGMYLGFGDYYPDALLTNTPTNAFLTNKRPEWEIRDEKGEPRDIIAGKYDNISFHTRCCCLGVDAYADWLARAQVNTIERYGLKRWDFDFNSWQFESPGCVCHAEGHRHLPGDSQYAQWRGALRTVEKIAAQSPELWMQCYWGLKPALPFALKNFDAMEMYYEYASHPNGEITDAAQVFHNANDVRFQAWASMNDRFLPSYLNYSPVEDGEFEILTAVAMGGALMFYNDIAEERKDFCRRWLKWARENLDLRDAPARWLFGPPRKDGLDGIARFFEERGVIFIFNPNRRAIGAEIPFQPELGFDWKASFRVREVYPVERTYSLNGTPDLAPGAVLRFDVPAESAMALEVAPGLPERPLFEAAASHPVQKALLTESEFLAMRQALGHRMPETLTKSEAKKDGAFMLD